MATVYQLMVFPADVAFRFEELPTAIVDGVAVTPVGGAGNVKVNPAKVAVPPGVVTLTLPVVPPETVAVILVAEFTV